MLPAPIYIMFHPAQHSPVHFLLRWHVEIVTGDQIQNLDEKKTKLTGRDILYNHVQELQVHAHIAFKSEKHKKL